MKREKNEEVGFIWKLTNDDDDYDIEIYINMGESISGIIKHSNNLNLK